MSVFLRACTSKLIVLRESETVGWTWFHTPVIKWSHSEEFFIKCFFFFSLPFLPSGAVKQWSTSYVCSVLGGGCWLQPCSSLAAVLGTWRHCFHHVRLYWHFFFMDSQLHLTALHWRLQTSAELFWGVPPPCFPYKAKTTEWKIIWILWWLCSDAHLDIEPACFFALLLVPLLGRVFNTGHLYKGQ